MKLKFQIDYRTRWGQEIYVSGSLPELGKWDEKKALPLSPGSGEHWEKEIDLKDPVEFDYKYFLKDEIGNIHWEFGINRTCQIKGEALKAIFLRDFWRPEKDHLNNLYTSPFYKSFFSRKTQPYRFSYKKSKSYIRFQLRAPRIGKDYSFGIVGSINELGKWKDDGVLIMSDEDFPVWKADIEISEKSLPFDYKFVIYSHQEKRVVTWEQRENRYFPRSKLEKDQVTVWSDEYFHYPVGNWKAAGVAIPVFSLRSEKGTGIGEFTDLIPFVDWSVKTGMRLVQILPVNDTIANQNWIDSYPYAAISVHALHPIYANLQEMGEIKDRKLQKEIEKERKRLNKLPEVDYEAVLKLKSRFFKASFDENKDRFLKSKEFEAFFKENKRWLVPYAAFSALRDEFKTPDFTKWGKYSTISEKQIKEFTSEKSERYDDIAVHYYIQYHLDRQLKKATEYARNNGVVLKGDIPIGIYRNSVDAWISPELYNMDCQAGAPPDDFSISGQNWGFPTYNWDRMAEDGFKWWTDRLVKMSEYFDVFRIDHILGFFRIWEIPWEYVEGIMGRFNPALPIHRNEFREWSIFFDQDRFCKPYIRKHVIHHIFQNHADIVIDTYLNESGPGIYEMKKTFDTQRKVKEFFDNKIKKEPHNSEFLNWMRYGLYRLHSEVLFTEAPLSGGEAFNPRIAFHSTFSFQELDEHTRNRLDEMYNHFFYHRHNDFWRESAMLKLPALKAATDMLICGEDLGMVPASVPGVMEELSILSLAIQRMPNDDRLFWHPSDTPYLSVTSTGSHDMSTLREWWQEDMDKTQLFYNNILGHEGGAPYFCEPWIAKDIINQHMYSPSMWAIFPLQDLLAMDGKLRREKPEEERINVPSNSQHYWKYRMHLTIEQLLQEDGFNGFLLQLVDQGGRKADY